MISALALLLLAAATPPASSPPAPHPVDSKEMVFDHSRLQVIWVDLDHADLRLLWDDENGKPLRTFAAAQNYLGNKAVVLTNAGIFEPGYKATGLLVSDGREISPLNATEGEGNFYLKPNGIFSLDAGGAHISETHHFNPPAGLKQATQSGPLLLWSGQIHLGLRPGSRNRLIRSAIGVAGTRRVALVVSRDPISLYAMAVFFRDELICDSALYLDGTISRLYASGLNQTELKSDSYAGIFAVVPHE